MQRGSGNCRAGEEHRLEMRNRSERACSSDLEHDIKILGCPLARWIFISNSPTRSFLRRAKLVLQSGRVDLYNQTIDLVSEIVAKCFLLVCKVNHFIDRRTEFAMRIYSKACLIKPVE